MSETPRKPRRRKKDTPSRAPLTEDEQRERAELVRDLYEEERLESMAGLIERAAALLKEAAELLLLDADREEFLPQREREALRVLVTFYEECGVTAALLQTMQFMAAAIELKTVLGKYPPMQAEQRAGKRAGGTGHED